MMLARVSRATLVLPNVNLLLKTPVSSKPLIPRLETVRLFANDGRSSFARSARRRMTIKEQIMAPAGEGGELSRNDLTF